MRVFILLLSLIPFSIFGQDNNGIKELSRKEIVQKLFTIIEEWLGTPYLYGGLTKQGVDCSGFAKVVYESVFNIDLPNGVSNQKNLGKLVEDNNFQPGDLLFFNTTGTISHVGIFVFNNKFIHAASAGPKIGVIKSSLDEKYYKEGFVFAKRIVELPKYQKEEQNNELEELANEFEENINKRELNTDNNNKIKEITLKIGKVLYKDQIYEESLFFKENSKIFIKIEPYNDNIKLVIENSDKLNITDRFKNNYLILEKGIYSIKIFDKLDNFLKEVTISVE